MSLPSYEEAMEVVEGLLTESKRENALKLVASYLDPHTLAVSSRVCKEWNEILTTELWANPVRSVMKLPCPFRRMIQLGVASSTARPFTRSQLMTLDAGKLLNLRHQEPHRKEWNQNDHVLNVSWFLSLMFLFPNLKFAILDELNGFSQVDWALYNAHISQSVETKKTESMYELVMLSGSNCRDLDGAKALMYAPFNKLWYLDLSYTNWQEDSHYCFNLSPIHHLRVLKLRGLRLTDGHFPMIYTADTSCLWSLDIRDNLFTDEIITDIVDQLLLPRPRRDIPTYDQDIFQFLYEDAPAYDPHSYENLVHPLVSIRPDSKEGFIRYLQDHGQISTSGAQLLDEHDPLARKTGLTQLYLSGNLFSHHKVRHLLNGNNQLQVLDYGNLVDRGAPRHITGHPQSARPLHRITGTRLEVLRVHHSVVTYCKTTCIVGTNYSWSHLTLQHDEVQGLKASISGDAFSPFDNHRITSLTLTGIPTFSYGFILQSLIEFLRKCIEQELQINAARARFPHTRTSPVLLPGLRILRLEFISESTHLNDDHRSSFSISGDSDADAFHAESNQDFSFFSSPSPSSVAKLSGTAVTSQKKYASQNKKVHHNNDIDRRMDVVKELKAFRAHEGKNWTGKLQLVFLGPDRQISNWEGTA